MKRVKELIDSGSYGDAAKILQEALSDPANQNFGLFSNLGSCLAKVGGRDHDALAAFNNALKHEPNPPNAPFFKSLSELHDRMEKYDDSGEALKRQYEVLVSRGNFAKAVEVGRSVVERWQKTAKQQKSLDNIEKSASFLYSLLREEWIEGEQSKMTTKEHMVMALKLLELQYKIVDIKAEAAKGRLSLSSSSASSNSNVNANSKVVPELDPEGSMMRCLTLLEALAPEDVKSTVTDSSFKRGVLQYLEGRRRALIQAGLDGAPPNRTEWKALLFTAIGLSHKSALPAVDICSLVVELWLYLGEDQDEEQEDDGGNSSFSSFRSIEALVQSTLAIDASHVAANVAVCVDMIEHGLARQTKSSALVCWSHWKALGKSIGEGSGGYADVVTRGHADKQVRLWPWAAYTVVAVKGLLGAPPVAGMATPDYLHLSQCAAECLHRQETTTLPVRQGWSHLVRLGRVSALASAGQVVCARREAHALLPLYFGAEEEPRLEDMILGARTDGHGARRLLLSCLLKLRWPLAAQGLTQGIIEATEREGESPPSYLVADGAYAAVLGLQEGAAGHEQGVAESLWSGSLKHTDLSSLYPANSDKVQRIVIALADLRRAAAMVDAYSQDIAASLQLRIGQTIWLAGGDHRANKACVTSLLASAKADPSQGAVYTLLGHYYYDVGEDRARATKCYLKALQCDPLEEEAGLVLSALYFAEADEEDERRANGESKEGKGQEGGLLRPSSEAEGRVLKLWADVTKLSSYAWWAHELRGRYLLQKALHAPPAPLNGDSGGGGGGDREDEVKQCLEAAVGDLQRSLELRGNVSPSSWYQLGVAYGQLGQLSSAKAALIRAHQQDKDSALPLSLLGSVCLRSAAFAEATKYLDMALALQPNEVPALKAAAEVCLVRAYEALQWNWTTGAARSMQSGLVHARGALACYEGKEEVPVCLWKLQGDLLMISRHVGESDLPSPRMEGLREAEQSYRMVLSLCSTDNLALANAWADVGSSLHAQLCLHYSDGGVGSGLVDKASFKGGKQTALVMAVQTTQKEAVSAFTQGLQLDERCVPCWFGLGQTLIDDELAAAALVRASQLDPSHSDAHLGLAVCYLKTGRDDAADAAVATVQMREGHPDAWVVRGLLAEKRGLSGTRSREREDMRLALDSYRVALEVSKPPEALLGAAVTFLRIHGVLSEGGLLCHSPGPGVSSLQYQHSVCVPLQGFLQVQPIHPTAWTLLGWAWEARGEIEKAVDAYVEALRSLEVILTSTTIAAAGAQRASDIAHTALVSLLRLLVLEKGSGSGSGIGSTLSDKEFPALFELVPESRQIAGLLGSLQQGRIAAAGAGVEVSSLLTDSPLLTPALLTAYLSGDMAATATNLGSTAFAALDSDALVAEYLRTLQRLSRRLDETEGRKLVLACAPSIANAIAPFVAISDLDSALEAEKSGGLLGALLRRSPTTSSIGAESLFVAVSALSVSMDTNSTERGALLLWGLQRYPYSAILWLALAQHGGGKVHEITCTALLSKGWLVVNEANEQQVWSASRCAEQVIRLSLVVYATSVGGGEAEEEDEGMSLWSQNHFEKPLYGVEGLPMSPAYCLGHAIPLLDKGNALLGSALMKKAAHQWPLLMLNDPSYEVYCNNPD